MADRTSLGILGLILGAATAMVILTAGFLVAGHIDGRMALDNAKPPMSLSVESE